MSLEPPEPYLNKTENEWFTMTPEPVDHNALSWVGSSLVQMVAYNASTILHHYMLDQFDQDLVDRFRVVFEWFGPMRPCRTMDFEAACAQDSLDGFVPTVGTWYSHTLPCS